MSNVSKSERATQDRVRALLRDELHYDDLGTLADRGDRNSHIEEALLTRHLAPRCAACAAPSPSARGCIGPREIGRAHV